MANFGFGSNNPGDFGAGVTAPDFDRLARQYWSAWGEMMRGATPQSAQPSAPGWNEALNWWSQLAKGGGQPQVEDTLDRFNSQARGWFGEIQKLAAQFAGRDASAGDIASAWKQALGGNAGNPFAEVMGAMRGPGQQDFGRWAEQVAPFLERLQGQGQSLLGLPAFGFAREHQERVQQLAQAHLDYQQQSQAYNALMAQAGQDAFARFEDKLAERSEPGRQVGSARALFDLWIDAAEDAYAQIALSPRFRDAYAALVNSQMRLRAGVQKEIEHASDGLGIPTRTEIDAAHRKIVQLERELRRLRDEVRAGGESRAAAQAVPVSQPSAPRRAASEQAATKQTATKQTATKQTATKQTAKKSKPRAAATKAAPVRQTGPKPAKKAVKKTAIARPQPPAQPRAAKTVKAGKSAPTRKSAKHGAR